LVTILPKYIVNKSLFPSYGFLCENTLMPSLKKYLKKVIPSRLHFKAVSLKHKFTKFKNTYYSQNGEDIILSSLFPKNYRGFYVDVGAHHPYRISNTYLLHKLGWKGINIDANPETIQLFEKARPHDINLNVGVGRIDTMSTYYTFSDPAVNTFSQTDAEHWKKKTFLEFLGTTTVQIRPLDKILEEYLPRESQSIDILSVDVEGLDLEVLQSNNWEKYSPRVIVAEDHDFNLEQMSKNPIYNLLREKGYLLSDKVKFSLIFVKDDKK
jgi:FkbM family methyltransferase